MHQNQRFFVLFVLFPFTEAYKGYRWQSPKFLHDNNTIDVSAPVDTTVYLHCKVTGLRDQTVSWYRRKGVQIHLLTFGFHSYHNDKRFSLVYEYPGDWRLQIQYVQEKDSGVYECQVPSDPPLIRTVHLHVIAPSIHILDDRGVIVEEKHYQTGSVIELECVVTQAAGLTSLEISWQRDDHPLNYDVERGGINVRTELRGSEGRSRLVIGGARIEDSGHYYCNVSSLAESMVVIHVLPDEYPAAIQGGPSWEPVLFHLLTFTLIHSFHVMFELDFLLLVT